MVTIQVQRCFRSIFQIREKFCCLKSYTFTLPYLLPISESILYVLFNLRPEQSSACLPQVEGFDSSFNALVLIHRIWAGSEYGTQRNGISKPWPM